MTSCARYDRHGRMTPGELAALEAEQQKHFAQAKKLADELDRRLDMAEAELAARSSP